jgi:hypothetical protein
MQGLRQHLESKPGTLSYTSHIFPLNLLVTKCEQRTEQVPAAAAAAAADKDEPWASTHKIALQLPNLLSMIHCYQIMLRQINHVKTLLDEACPAV